ncbi:MAG: hypothetical protein K0R00_463 [Herbinix sp.]|jgi:nucleoside 2-deoxyribosyltransferase|nr:hypothetical protein [Herbinix sp.]
MQNKRILIVGEIFVDTHLDIKFEGNILTRLGGIFHAIRGCAALNIEYSFAYYAPTYLFKDIEKYSESLNAISSFSMGIIDRAPNVILICNSDESVYQGYNNILSDQTEYIHTGDLNSIIAKVQPTDIMMFPGRYITDHIIDSINNFQGKVHIDLNYDSNELINKLSKQLDTCILSTSSDTFKSYFKSESYAELINYFKSKDSKLLIIKENRGGSVAYTLSENNKYESPAFLSDVMHSVGVGDVYDIIYISDLCIDIELNMRLAALCSVAYAKTMDFSIFKNEINVIMQNVMDSILISGVRVDWFSRRKINIYIAAPDFDYNDRCKIDLVASSLEYHNFSPRLPIRENGQVSEKVSYHEKRNIYYKDLAMLSECDILVAVLLYNDQGTLTEIGMFKQMGKPVIIYDPDKIVNNMFLENSCDYYCTDISKVIKSIFLCSNMGDN